MTDDPFLTLIVEALNVMHPRFAGAGDAALVREFYHQFRRLWDKGLPVQLGLGHVMLQDDPELPPGPWPDFLFWQLSEKGQPDRRLGVVSFATTTDLAAMERLRTDLGYPHAVCVVVGRSGDLPASGLPQTPGVSVVVFDTDRWQARILS